MMLGLEDVGKKFVLALEMMIKRPFRELCFRSDVVHRDAAVALSAKQLVGRLQNAIACRFRGSGQCIASVKVYSIVNLQDDAAK